MALSIEQFKLVRIKQTAGMEHKKGEVFISDNTMFIWTDSKDPKLLWLSVEPGTELHKVLWDRYNKKQTVTDIKVYYGSQIYKSWFRAEICGPKYKKAPESEYNKLPFFGVF